MNRQETAEEEQAALTHSPSKIDCHLQNQTISYWQYYAEACNEWRDPSPRHSAWTTQLRTNVAVVASRWRQHVRFERTRNRSPDVPRRQRCLSPQCQPITYLFTKLPEKFCNVLSLEVSLFDLLSCKTLLKN